MAVATSAVRDASNRRVLLERLRREVGVTVQVLSGEEEARLGAQAALSSLPFRNGVVADLGGGSLQLTQVRGGSILLASSFPLGAVRTTAQFFKNDPPTKQEIQTLRQEIQRYCERDLPSLYKGEEIIGLGGTVRTLARMHLAALDKERSRQGLCLRRSDVSVLRERIEGLPVRARTRLRGLKEERADIIFAGTIVLEEVMRLGGYRTLTVCTSGVRQGLLLRETFA
jgi:exopolyphosphatase/guanosine-5'-triphosphate,3'-diphosphate pyrophosphatase